MSKKNIFLILTVIFLVFDVVLALVVFKPGVFKFSKLAEESLPLKQAKDEQPIKVAEDESGAILSVNTEEVGQYEKFEISFNNNKAYNNPFNLEEVDVQAHFISPSGKEELWPAFWHQDFQKSSKTEQKTTTKGEVKTATQNVYTAFGAPYWKVRYSPLETGEYQYYLTIKDQVGESRYPADGSQLSFSVKSSKSKGFLKVASNKQYFQFDDGSPYFGIGYLGHNNIVGTLNECQIKDEFNWTQVEFDPKFFIEHQKIGQYDLERAFKADETIALGEEMGVYFQMVFEHWSHWGDDMSKIAGWFGGNLDEFEAGLFEPWAKNVYNKESGGPINYPAEYFTNQQAINYEKQLFRYWLARWGYSTNVLNWQFWGEYNSILASSSDVSNNLINDNQVLAWHLEMAKYLKSIDSRHLVASNEVPSAVWSIPEIDFAIFHLYADDLEWQAAKLIDEYQQYNKPVFIQEFGVANPEWDNQEIGLTAFHNILWQAVINNHAGAPMKFGWVNQDNDYKIISNFFGDLDTGKSVSRLSINDLSPKQNFEPITRLNRHSNSQEVLRPGGQVSPVEIFGFYDGAANYLWIHDIRNTTIEIQNYRYQPQTMSNIKFQINNLPPGKYQVEFINTWTGQIVSTLEVQSSINSLIVEVPEFQKDIAVKIIKK